MAERKTYGQFCGLARSLDLVGDRWTLLVVRELLLAPQSFRELEAALPGISPSLLTARMAELVEAGIVQRNDAPRRSKAVTYDLTDAGHDLEPAVLELIRWGARWMTTGPGDDHVDPRWAPLAVRAMLDGAPASGGRLHLDVEGTPLTVHVSRRRRAVTAGHHGRADATVHLPMAPLLGVVSGALALDDAAAEVTGDDRVARMLLEPPASPGRQRQPLRR